MPKGENYLVKSKTIGKYYPKVNRKKSRKKAIIILAALKKRIAREVRDQKLREGQEIGEVVLDAEARMGELLREIPKAKGGQPFHEHPTIDTAVQSRPQTKSEAIAEIGISQKQAERFQTLAAHPEAVAQAKAEAREKGEIVTRSAAL